MDGAAEENVSPRTRLQLCVQSQTKRIRSECSLFLKSCVLQEPRRGHLQPEEQYRPPEAVFRYSQSGRQYWYLRFSRHASRGEESVRRKTLVPAPAARLRQA